MKRTTNDLFAWGNARSLRQKAVELSAVINQKLDSQRSKICKGTARIIQSHLGTPCKKVAMVPSSTKENRCANNGRVQQAGYETAKICAELPLEKAKPILVRPVITQVKDPQKKILPNCIFFLKDLQRPATTTAKQCQLIQLHQI